MLAELPWNKIFDMPQILFIVGCLIAITCIIAGAWCKANKVQSDNNLKRTLVERGLTADEIERIIVVNSKEPRDSD